jgi:hypothetical protein
MDRRNGSGNVVAGQRGWAQSGKVKRSGKSSRVVSGKRNGQLGNVRVRLGRDKEMNGLDVTDRARLVRSFGRSFGPAMHEFGGSGCRERVGNCREWLSGIGWVRHTVTPVG